MQLPAAAYPIPDLWPENHRWATAWWWLHKRRPDSFNGERYIGESDINAYAAREDLDGPELALAIDRIDAAYFEWKATTAKARQ